MNFIAYCCHVGILQQVANRSRSSSSKDKSRAVSDNICYMFNNDEEHVKARLDEIFLLIKSFQ